MLRAQVPPDELLLAPDAEALGEAAHGQEGLAADDDGAGDEREDGVARLAVGGGQGRPGHLRADRVVALLGAHEDVGLHDRQAGMGVHEVGRSAQGAGLPPGVVVREGHVGRADRPGARIARARAAVAIQAQHLHLRVGGGDRAGGPVRGGVVGEEDVRALGQREVPRDRLEQLGPPVAGDDDDGGAGIGGRGHGS